MPWGSSQIRWPDIANKGTGCPVNYKFQIGTEKYLSTVMSHNAWDILYTNQLIIYLKFHILKRQPVFYQATLPGVSVTWFLHWYQYHSHHLNKHHLGWRLSISVLKVSSWTTNGKSGGHLSFRLLVVPKFPNPLGISVCSFRTRPWGFQVPPKIIYYFALQEVRCSTAGVALLQAGHMGYCLVVHLHFVLVFTLCSVLLRVMIEHTMHRNTHTYI